MIGPLDLRVLKNLRTSSVYKTTTPHFGCEVYMRTTIHTYIHLKSYTHIQYMHTNIQINTHTYIHTYIHT